MHRRVAKARTFKFRSLWRYDHKAKKWVKVDDKVKKPVILEPVEHTVYSPKTDPIL